MLFDFGGEQMALYFGKVGRFTVLVLFIDMLLQDLGDLIVVTLNKLEFHNSHDAISRFISQCCRSHTGHYAPHQMRVR